MHLLELAKTAWNITIREQVPKQAEASSAMLQSCQKFLDLATQALDILGEEGDEGYGPAEECTALRALLES